MLESVKRTLKALHNCQKSVLKSEQNSPLKPSKGQIFSPVTLFLADFLDHFDVQLTLALSYMWISFFTLSNSDPLAHSTTFHGWYFVTAALAYPLGAFVFGAIASRWSSTVALRWSILGFSMSTLGMGLLPDIQDVQKWPFFALLMMVTCRFLQSFFARGERALLPIYLVESGDKNKDIDRASLLEFSTFLGCYAAASVASWIIKDQGSNLLPGGGCKNPNLWRLPFLMAGLLGCVLTWWRWKSMRSCGKQSPSLAENYSKTLVQNQTELEHSIAATESSPKEKQSWVWFLALIAISGPWYLFYALAFKLNLFYAAITKIEYTAFLDQSAYFFGIDLLFVLLIRFFLKSKAGERNSSSKALEGVCLMGMTLLIPCFALMDFFPSLAYLFGLGLVLIALGVYYAMNFFLFIRNLLLKCSEPYLSIGTAKMIGTLALGHSCAYLSLKIYHLTHWTCAPGVYGTLVCMFALWGLRWWKKQEDSQKTGCIPMKKLWILQKKAFPTFIVALPKF